MPLHDMQAVMDERPDTALTILERRLDGLTRSIDSCTTRCGELEAELRAEQARRASLSITKASVAGALNRLRDE